MVLPFYNLGPVSDGVFYLKCIELMGDGCLNNEHFEELGGILKGKLEEHFKNQELRQGKPSLQPCSYISLCVRKS